MLGEFVGLMLGKKGGTPTTGIPTCENSGGWGGIRIPGTRIFSPLGGFPFKIPYPLNNSHLATFYLRFG